MSTDFDILNAPLRGFHLLDASAGTGKTYTLTGLFLRLVLEKKLGVDEILVVTYTRAATADLRARIRERLVECLAVLQGEQAGDELINRLISEIPDGNKGRAALHDALRNFDQAAIFTIHGFCQRILQENSLETDTAFDLAVEPDFEQMVRGAVLDFWRRTVTRASPGLLTFAGYRLQPEGLVRLASRMRAGLEILPNIDRERLRDLLDGSALREREDRLRERVSEVRDFWSREGESIRSILKKNEGLHKTVACKLDKYFAEIDLFLATDRFLEGNLPEAFDKFASSQLAAKTKKNYEPPCHAFFDLCENIIESWWDLEKTYEFLVVALQVESLDFVETELDRRKEKAGVVSYDDLLLFLARALESESEGVGGKEGKKPLAHFIRRKYKAALIDEFQDTDPLQYRIFSRVYQDSPANLLYIIGDPKQAIYSFRGADVYSYLAAARSASSRESLVFNYRSQPDLIRAVNTIFSRNANPFLFEEIAFAPVAPAVKNDREELLVDGEAQAPFKLWLGVRNVEKPGLVKKPEAVQNIVTALASEICTLLSQARLGRIKIGKRRLKAGDIAVLVRKNAEVYLVREGLRKVGVSSVVQAAGDLFKTREAMELEIILKAVGDPCNEIKIRSALATDFFPDTVTEITGLTSNEDAIAACVRRFQGYRDLWQNRGFIAMFRTLLERERFRKQALRFFDGERRLTNILHLGELLERYTREYHKGINSVLRYLRESRCSEKGERDEERQMRLESDEERVRIVTIHTSKGLQYPVVFCPFSWGALDPGRQEGVFFHRKEDLQPCLDLGSESINEHRETSRREVLAEEVRLLYVALTRAVHRCYMVWGPFNTAQNSALGRLLHNLPESGAGKFKDMSDEEILHDLIPLTEQSRGAIEVTQLPWRKCFLASSFEPDVELVKPVFRGHVPSDFRIASFSYMAGQARSGREQQAEEGRGSADDLSFPKGAKAGTFFHDLLERVDFDRITENITGEIGNVGGAPAHQIRRLLHDYGYEPGWQDTVLDILKKTVTTPLNGKDLYLKDLDARERLIEMEFHFELGRFSGRNLSSVLTRHGGRYGKIAALDYPQMRGFMKGYVDLVFSWKGRYFILDWKTNYLGSDSEDYLAERLEEVMIEEQYILQYLIYTVALNRYLGSRLADYSYPDHFGGIYYLFLRGLDPERGRECGIYHDLPPANLIDELTAVFSGGG